ncbi:hypothetical protein ACFOY2_12500 [Nonomuraea purpurea]|uniref:Lipoprotein n=1 Tax=Nonomuraea purpurea TaxID=1849276 RepID=A0ABV8G236_9ACTN
MALLAAVCGCAGIGWNERPQAVETPAATATSPKVTKDPADARELYLESLRQQALQPSLNLVQEYYRQKGSYPGGSRTVVVSGFDYGTKDVRLEKTEVIVADGKTWTAGATWCIDGSKDWSWNRYRGWTLRSSLQCPSLPSQAWLNDGLGVGGLTEKQADTFVGELAGIEGLITAGRMSNVKRDGKSYVRLEIQVKPQQLGGGGMPVGAGLYLDAFKYTELDAITHPYGLLAGGRSAMDIVRYIDPETRLPVYSETLETGEGTWAMHRVEYEFGSPVGKSVRPTKPSIAQLAWQPEES